MATIRDGDRDVLIVVDVQVAVMSEAWEAKRIIGNIVKAVDAARARGIPVIWVQHSDEELVHGTDEWQLVPELAPADDEPVIHKHHQCSFEATDLEAELAKRDATRIVLAGAATNWCIRATAYGALDRGYDLTLVSDAHSTGDMDLGNGETIPASHIVTDLNAVMTWLSYPGRTCSTARSGDIEWSVQPA